MIPTPTAVNLSRGLCRKPSGLPHLQHLMLILGVSADGGRYDQALRGKTVYEPKEHESKSISASCHICGPIMWFPHFR